MRQCIDVILTRIFSVIDIKVGPVCPKRFSGSITFRELNICIMTVLVLNFEFLKGTMLLGKEILSKMQSLTLQVDVSSTNCE